MKQADLYPDWQQVVKSLVNYYGSALKVAYAMAAIDDNVNPTTYRMSIDTIAKQGLKGSLSVERGMLLKYLHEQMKAVGTSDVATAAADHTAPITTPESVGIPELVSAAPREPQVVPDWRTDGIRVLRESASVSGVMAMTRAQFVEYLNNYDASLTEMKLLKREKSPYLCMKKPQEAAALDAFAADLAAGKFKRSMYKHGDKQAVLTGRMSAWDNAPQTDDQALLADLKSLGYSNFDIANWFVPAHTKQAVHRWIAAGKIPVEKRKFLQHKLAELQAEQNQSA